MNTANEQVRTLMSSRNDERMQIGKAALATAREEADQAYCDLVLALNASAVMDDDAHRFDELISQVNELIKYYRLYVVPKPGKKDEESEEGGNNAGGNGGGNGNANGGSSSGSENEGNGSSSGSENAGSGGSSEGSGSESGSGSGSGSDDTGGSSSGSDDTDQ